MMQPHPHSPYDSHNLIAQCQTEMGWSPSFAVKVFDEYCKFLKLVAMEHQNEHDPELRRNCILVAPPAIARMWRHHSLDTQQYTRECQSVCGEVIPYQNDTSVDDVNSQLRRFHATMIASEARFGEIPNSEEWKFGATYYGSIPLPDDAVESSQTQDKTNSSSPTVTIRVRETSPNQMMAPFESVFRMKARTPLHRVFDLVESRRRQGGSISFRFGGRDIDRNVSASQLGMVNGDQITAVWRQPPQRRC